MKRKILYIICVMFIMILITGCGDPLTAKQQAQNEILRELRYCDQKFGSNDNDARTLKNSEYCAEMRLLVENLIYDGWFDEVGDTKLQNVMREKEIEQINNKEDTTVNDEMNKMKQNIIGTI